MHTLLPVYLTELSPDLKLLWDGVDPTPPAEPLDIHKSLAEANVARGNFDVQTKPAQCMDSYCHVCIGLSFHLYIHACTYRELYVS